MVPKKSQQGVRVLITTYKTDLNKTETGMEFEERRHAKLNTNKFICSICLNAKDMNHGKVLCKACQKSYNNIYNDNNKDTDKHEEMRSAIKANKEKQNVKNDQNAKCSVVKEQTDLSQGLNLLNEVLMVFKSKKQNIQNTNTNSSKTLIFKDVCTSTDNDCKPDARPKLVLSKVFLCSIEGHKDDENCKFTIVNSSQPKYFRKECIIDLKKHKSSSIPQMKMDELKNSLKEKAKPKDINEEVSRMFATVTMNSINRTSDHSNRPVTRRGPRVLPVVKTDTNQNNSLKQSCKCCQTSEHCLSSGDSFVESKTNQRNLEKSQYHSHYQKNDRLTQTDVALCQNCRNTTERCCHCEKSFQSNYYQHIG